MTKRARTVAHAATSRNHGFNEKRRQPGNATSTDSEQEKLGAGETAPRATQVNQTAGYDPQEPVRSFDPTPAVQRLRPFRSVTPRASLGQKQPSRSPSPKQTIGCATGMLLALPVSERLSSDRYDFAVGNLLGDLVLRP